MCYMCKFYDAFYEFTSKYLRATTKSLQGQRIHNGKCQTMIKSHYGLPNWVPGADLGFLLGGA